MLTTNTHDTKRSADVRARIAALTWMPDEWSARVRRWLEVTESLRSDGAPDDLERYFLFQTLVGAWPIELERIQGYMEKALREAKRNTNWVDRTQAWERGVLDFCRGAVLAPAVPGRLRAVRANGGRRSATGSAWACWR